MKSSEILRGWHKRRADKLKRQRLFGWLLLFFALLACAFAYLARSAYSSLTLSLEEQEGLFMVALVLAGMGLFCLNSLWQKETFYD